METDSSFSAVDTGSSTYPTLKEGSALSAVGALNNATDTKTFGTKSEVMGNSRTSLFVGKLLSSWLRTPLVPVWVARHVRQRALEHAVGHCPALSDALPVRVEHIELHVGNGLAGGHVHGPDQELVLGALHREGSS